jgi:hypothetical protein
MSVNQQYTDQVVVQPGGPTIPGVVSPAASGQQVQQVQQSGASPGAGSTPISQANIDAFQQLQQRSMETIRNFTTQPTVSGGGRGGASQRSGGATGNGSGAPQQPGSDGNNAVQNPMPISTSELYDIMYSRDMNRRWADTRDEWSSDDDDLDRGHYDDDDDDGDQDEEQDAMDENDTQSRSPLFGGTRGQQAEPQTRRRPRPPQPQPHSDMEEEDEAEYDDNPRPRKRRHCEYSAKHRNECFLCAWGNKFHDGIAAPHVNKLIDIIDTNYGVHHNREIANELHLYFKYEIYDPASGMQMLTREIALEHIESMHTLNARIFLGESIKQEKQLSFLFLNAIWRPDPAGGFTYDKVAADQYRKSQKSLRELYLMPLNKMNFSNGNNAEDLKRAANYMNLMMPRFEQKVAPQRQQQQQQHQQRGGKKARQPRPGSDAPVDDSSVPPIRKRFG